MFKTAKVGEHVSVFLSGVDKAICTPPDLWSSVCLVAEARAVSVSDSKLSALHAGAE